MSEPSSTTPPPQRWWAVALGPALFLLTELLFRPELDLAPELLASAPEASELLVRHACLLYTSPSPRDLSTSRMPSSA